MVGMATDATGAGGGLKIGVSFEGVGAAAATDEDSPRLCDVSDSLGAADAADVAATGTPLGLPLPATSSSAGRTTSTTVRIVATAASAASAVNQAVRFRRRDLAPTTGGLAVGGRSCGGRPPAGAGGGAGGGGPL